MGAPGFATVLVIDEDMVDQIAHPVSKMMIGNLCNASVGIQIDPRSNFKIGHRFIILSAMKEWNWYFATNVDVCGKEVALIYPWFSYRIHGSGKGSDCFNGIAVKYRVCLIKVIGCHVKQWGRRKYTSRGFLAFVMDLPPYSVLPESINLAPIALDDLDRTTYRRNDNELVPGSTLDPLDVFEIFSCSFAFQETQIFRSAMIKASAIMVGSSAMASIGIVEIAAPQRLDILVGSNGSRYLHTALRNFGFMSAPERVREDYARTVGGVWAYHRAGHRSVNIIECHSDTVWQHVLSALSTAHTSFLSATHVFVLDPELTFNKVALLRGTDFPPIQQDNQHWLQLLRLGWEVYRHNGASGFTLNVACPAFRRSLWGGEGIWHASWSDTLASGEDYYYQLAALSFKHEDLWYIWQWATHCSDWTCEYAWMTNRLSIDGLI
ncbi:hypothetical protein BT96DRAFT_993293 [Gymnopus androsaceus JB14]|uniref:Uncharacterized protein n=1 Tax=Gymnopus androsaceus JB14 TaxID=1447944 RepID=A0A6A4HTU7_9AGAR|nr:hypothetical protein BT96DRAFT_993293 [Gymnopus androsaceus JB14]